MMNDNGKFLNRFYIIENLSKTFCMILLNCKHHLKAMSIKDKVQEWYELYLLERQYQYDIGFNNDDLELIVKVFNGSPKDVLSKYPLNFLIMDDIENDIFNNKIFKDEMLKKIKKGEKNDK